tara:strand:- start:1106 stop:3232 length:2127 start_codon:yes stop_codon:yes gene_type:complete
MAVKHEIKSQLAKLLATEDLVVEHRHVETAQFNVQTRVLTLPLWEKASNVVYDMLVGHEVGHALFTPNQDPPKGIPHSFINIVEDARIEKLMKRKYMGLAKTFYGGYKELSDEDFFCLEGEDVSNMNLGDRANLWFKIGNYIDIDFTDEEQEIIDMISDVETFGDVAVAAEALYKFCKKEKEQEKVDNIMTPPQVQGSSGQESEEVESQTESKSEGGSSDEQQEQQSQNTPIAQSPTDTGDSVEEIEPEVSTVSNLEESLRDLVGKCSAENVYLEIPKVNLDTVIISNKKIHFENDQFFSKQEQKLGSVYEKADTDFVQFKRSAQKEVNYLVKEFECKKAADSYARATTARTGVLDCSKLHQYKYNEDLFKKVTTLAEGKNHGLVFVLDWSGSMSNVMLDTIKQLYNLIWFCKKVSIPFEVYAFTNEWNRSAFDYETGRYDVPDVKPHYEAEEDLFSVPEYFSMLNILTSKVSVKELESQMINIWRIAHYLNSDWGCSYSIPQRMGLSGTPLNEAFVALHQILPKFQRENKLQKVQCIVLSDGEANHLSRHVEYEYKGEVKIGARRLNPDTCFIRDRKVGKTYKVPYSFHGFADQMLTNLKDNFPYVNFIGIRVLESRDASSFMKLYCKESGDFIKTQSEWKKQRSFTIRKSGYHAYFAIAASALSQDTEFDVDEGATKAKIKSAFIKSLKTKKLNKKVLGEFISLVV